MEETIKSRYEILLEKLDNEGKVEIIDQETTEKMLDQVDKNLQNHRFENQQKIKDSLENITTVVLTA